MPRRKAESGQHHATPAVGIERAGVLVAASRKSHRESLAAAMAPCVARIEACEPDQAPRLAREFDVVLIDCPHPLEAWMRTARAAPGVCGVILRERPEAAFLHEALRAGVADVVPPGDEHALAATLAAAFARAQCAQGAIIRERRRSRRLRALCGSLFRSRGELMKQMGDLCSDMSTSYRELSDQLGGVSMAGELRTILRQELDLENLLRTTLEYTLRKVGSTNAAIFLPNSMGDYSLGAYVNYDCAKDSCESLLEHLADSAARFQERDEPLSMPDYGQITTALGQEAQWLGDATMLAVPCRHDGESVAVALFFRDRRTPFSAGHQRTLSLIAELFGAQLSRVIRTHNRLPKNKWEAGEASQDDLAA